MIVGGLATSAMIAAISTDWHRNKAMPIWLCWLGYVCAVVLLGGVVFIPMIAMVLWAIVVGVVLLSRGAKASAAA